MEKRSNNKYKITKTRDFPHETKKKLENSEIIYRKSKNNEETV